MAILTVARRRQRESNKSRLIIRTVNNSVVYRARFAPREVEYSGYESVYQEVERPGRQPLLRKSAEALRRISMEIFVGGNNIEQDVNADLVTLENLAANASPIRIEYEPRTHGDWRIESLSYSSVDRKKTDNKITRALVTIEFVEIPKKKKRAMG